MPKVVPKKKDQEKVTSVQKKQAMVIYLNSFTVFCTVIFLQIMMFLRNAVPMTNDILMSNASSITYFIMSIVTLIFLKGCHEASSYMLLMYYPIITLVYGLILLILGIVCTAVDVGGANAAATEKWATLSPNQ